MNSSTKRIILAWIPVVFWLGIIAVESTGMMSSGNTDSVLYSVLTAIVGHVDRQRFEFFHALLRKCGHFSGYAILSLLFFRALLRTVSVAAAAAAYKVFAAVSVIFTFLVASLDEWHQAFLPSRTGAFSDVLLDTSGAVVVQIVLLLVVRRKQKRTLRTGARMTLLQCSETDASERGTCASSSAAASTANPADK